MHSLLQRRRRKNVFLGVAIVLLIQAQFKMPADEAIVSSAAIKFCPLKCRIPKFQRRVIADFMNALTSLFLLKNGLSKMVKLIIVKWLLEASFEYHFCGQIDQPPVGRMQIFGFGIFGLRFFNISKPVHHFFLFCYCFTRYLSTIFNLDFLHKFSPFCTQNISSFCTVWD